MKGMRAEDAAVAVAREFGLSVTRAVMLADSNNVVVRLHPSPVVAKVGTGHHDSLQLELDVVRISWLVEPRWWLPRPSSPSGFIASEASL